MQPQRLSLNELVTRLSRLFQRVLGDHIPLDVVTMADLSAIEADTGMVEQVVLNLVVNAREAMPKGGRVTLLTLALDVDEAYRKRVPQARVGRWVGVQVRDTGEGIQPDVLPRIFEPFLNQANEANKPAGLGLAAVYSIVKQHQGWMQVESPAGEGARFTAWFPAIEPVPAAATAPATQREKGHETILVVEDKEAVRAILQAVLERQGYRALMATNGEEALALWSQHKEAIGLLFTDVVMPGGVTERDLADRLRLERPSLKVVFCSGYGADIIGPEIMTVPNNRFLAKPFDIGRLAEVVRELLDAS